MVSRNKMSKTSKRHHWGRDGKYLKYQGRCKGTAIFTSSERKRVNEVFIDSEYTRHISRKV